MKQKILIADDDPAILDALKIMLEDDGYEVETSLDAIAYLDMKKPYPNLLLLDIWMSGVNGGDICKLIKNTPGAKNVPVILISATKNIEQIATNSGADGFISKPFQMNDLLAIVAKHVYSY